MCCFCCALIIIIISVFFCNKISSTVPNPKRWHFSNVQVLDTHSWAFGRKMSIVQIGSWAVALAKIRFPVRDKVCVKWGIRLFRKWRLFISFIFPIHNIFVPIRNTTSQSLAFLETVRSTNSRTPFTTWTPFRHVGNTRRVEKRRSRSLFSGIPAKFRNSCGSTEVKPSSLCPSENSRHGATGWSS